jgi:hypothetical protein
MSVAGLDEHYRKHSCRIRASAACGVRLGFVLRSMNELTQEATPLGNILNEASGNKIT